jgi:endo-1,4-beta-xylanase
MINVTSKLFSALFLVLGSGLVKAQHTDLSKSVVSGFTKGSKNDVMTEAYWKIWNNDVQKKIDQDIDKHRKANASLRINDVQVNTEVRIEQISHDFIFGSSIFNFDQLGTPQRNMRYKALFGDLFNSATIPFYWKKFELEPGRPRFKGEFWDSEEFWNSVSDPKSQSHWRRPAPDPIIDYYTGKGVRLHGHTLTWGNSRWQHPEWLYELYCPKEEKAKLEKLTKEERSKLTHKQVAELAPTYAKELKRLYEKRITEIAKYYGDRLPSWDVVNESAVDFHGQSVTGDGINNSKYGVLLPGDYVHHSFKKANEVFPKNVLLNINDYANNQNYTNQVKNLLANGSRIDIMGSQMHLFNPKQCLDISEGKEIETPKQVWDKMNIMSQANLPIHLSEITITAPSDDAKGRAIQSVISYNLYRLWFSVEKMMGITWWNIVDDCGAPGEPTTSGLFTRNMEPKPSYFALNELINKEWKTVLAAKSEGSKPITFRGFKGKYRVTWKTKSGESKEAVFDLKNDGDGF